MKPEIKLKVVAEEIKEILRKHDVAAAVVLHTPGHGEYFIHLNTSYSCAYYYDEEFIRFRAKLEDFNSVEERNQKQSDTANMLHILTECTGFNFLALEPLTKKIDEVVQAKHF